MIEWNKPTVVSVQSAMVPWFCGRCTSKRWVLKIVQETVNHDPFDAMYKCHVDFYIHLAFTYSDGPPFPPIRVEEVQWSRALSLGREVALKVDGCHLDTLSEKIFGHNQSRS